MDVRKIIAFFGLFVVVIGVGTIFTFFFPGLAIIFLGALIIFSVWKGAGRVLTNTSEYLTEWGGQLFAKTTTSTNKHGKGFDYGPLKEKINLALKEMTVKGVAGACFVAGISIVLITWLLFGLTFTETQAVWFVGFMAIAFYLWQPAKTEKAIVWAFETIFGLISKGIAAGGAVRPFTLFVLSVTTGFAMQAAYQGFGTEVFQTLGMWSFMIAIFMAIWMIMAFGKVQTTKK